ncbi:MAG: C10 family peptidase [Bacteroidales bacterium]|nr:C10 family peptidase [Bacteroidales bacterium]
MKSNRTIMLLAAAAVAVGMQAATITPAQALARAGQDPSAHKVAGNRAAGMRLVHTRQAADGEPAVYIFNAAKSGDGYLVLSADDLAYPVLGYADSGEFDAEAMPEAMRWWLDQYAGQIAYARGRAAVHPVMAPAGTAADTRQPIAPMITTDWDQDEPYNLQCPSYNAMHTYTGCVATAMAQVMKYWEYPERGTGTISYTSTSIQKRLSMNFGAKEFDWANMLDRYKEGAYTDEQAAAVAYLMKACGHAVKMDYGTDSSGALAMNIARALTKYFKYDGNIDYQLRQYHSSSEWADMIYRNLKEVGPILYGGASTIGGGHSFICDGYSSDGYFHFNWGWTGMSNGYFLLESLDPYALGAGGGMGGGYNFTQDAVLGIQPPTGDPVVERPEVLTQCGSLAGVVKDGTLFFDLFAEEQAMWVNYNPSTLKVRFGVRIEPQGTTGGSTRYAAVSDKAFSIEPGYGTAPSMFDPALDLAAVNLPDGTYKLTIVTADPEVDPDGWQDIKVNYGYYTSLVLRRSGSAYEVDNHDVSRLSVVGASVAGNSLYYGCTNRITVKVTNDNDIELSSGFAPVIVYNNSPVMLGESIYLSLKPGETVERTWDTDLYLLSQYFGVDKDIDVYLTFFDEATYNMYTVDYYKKFTMHPNPGTPAMSALSVTIPGRETVSETFQGARIKVYQLGDETATTVNARLRLDKGMCAYNVYACLASTEVDAGGNVAVLNYAGSPVYIANPGETADFSTMLDLSEARPGELYSIMMAYGFGQDLVPVSGSVAFLRTGTGAGVDDISADASGSLRYTGGMVCSADGATIEVYDTAGVMVAAGVGCVDVSDLETGIYVARSDGESIKIAL